MPYCTFVGYRYVDYISKSGKPVKGYSIYLTEERQHIVGEAAFDCWISVESFENYFSSLSIGEKISLSYDRYGHVVSCTVV